MAIHRLRSSLIQLFIFFLCFSNSVTGQQPGGVEGTRLWYVTVKKGASYVLQDSSGNNLSLTTQSGSRNINFHPAYLMRENTRLLPHFAFNQATVAAAFFPVENASDNDIYFQTTYLGNTFTLKNNNVRSGSNEKRYTYGNIQHRSTLEVKEPTKQENALKTAVYYYASSKTYNSVWGEDKQTDFFTNFKGILPELIIYNRVLSPTERLKVESYLSIKYGTTLDTSYIGRNGQLLWNINDTTLRRFHNRVCAIGKDSLAAIFQPKSNSTYEEEFNTVNSFTKDANDSTIINGWHYIPANEEPSLYRSVTIGFDDKTLNSLKEGNYIFWGDNSLSTKPDEFKERYKTQYPALKTVKRDWLIFNPDKLTQPLRIVIAGGDYKQETLYNTLYDPYDYQLYRFVIIKKPRDNSQKIEKPILCSYFGREQNGSSFRFNTRAIIWDSLSFKHESGYNFITFGKVPILNFLMLNNQFDNHITKLQYPYYQDSAIRAETNFDTTTLVFNYTTKDSILKFSFKTSVGVGTLTAKLYLLQPNGQLSPLPAGFIPNNQILADSSVRDTTIKVNEDTNFEIMPPNEDNPSNVQGNSPKAKLKYIKRTVPPDKQKFKEFHVNIPLKKGLTPDSKFLIEVTDDINQRTTLPIKIKRTK